jgi:hypothetical protein
MTDIFAALRQDPRRIAAACLTDAYFPELPGHQSGIWRSP